MISQLINHVEHKGHTKIRQSDLDINQHLSSQTTYFTIRPLKSILHVDEGHENSFLLKGEGPYRHERLFLS